MAATAAVAMSLSVPMTARLPSSSRSVRSVRPLKGGSLLKAKVVKSHSSRGASSPAQALFGGGKKKQAEEYVEYDKQDESVFPDEACDDLGGEFCEPDWREKNNVGKEVRSEAQPRQRNNSSKDEPDRDYVNYESSNKTVFPGEACDDLGGEFCEPDYQEGVGKEGSR
eukprot:jgi/Chlat1/3324/Chrsp22S03476